MSSFAGRVVLITGAASGIGRQFAVVLAAEGARIAALDRNADLLKTLEDELKGKPFAAAVADVTDAAAVERAVRDLEARLGPTDLLIASAGLGMETTAVDFRAETFADVIRVNLIGVSNSVAAVLPGMRERKSGHIAALSSLASYRGMPRMSAYSASKAGVNALCDSLRVELKPFNIAVTTFCPGWIRTPMTGGVRLPNWIKMMPVEEAVRRMIGALRRRRPFYAFPFRDWWQVVLLRLLPRRCADWLVNRTLGQAELEASRERQRPE